MQVPRFSAKGFTLIELLIVVAIIAILAAIAVPNFLEAQTRAKVSRIKSDVRSFVTAVESYRLDNNKLFPTTRSVNESRTFIWSYVTTPIAYMSSVPQDVFNNKDANPNDRVVTIWGPDFLDGNTTIRHRNGTSIVIGNTDTRTGAIFSPYPTIVGQPGNTILQRGIWAILSFGPDQVFDVNRPVFPSPAVPYDPTNGTISNGDIVRTSVGTMN